MKPENPLIEGVVFNGFDFLCFCENQYLRDYCSQEEAAAVMESGELSLKVRELPAWQLVVWLGDYWQGMLEHREVTNDK